MKNNYTKMKLLMCSSILAAQCVSTLNVFASTSEIQGDTSKNTLKGRAVLPAATFAPGPTSGKLLGTTPLNGQPVPFIDKQPVQGFSAILKNADGTYMVMCDNGYGGIENSADFNLRVYTIKPDFKTAAGGTGNIAVNKFFELRDPERKIPFAITNHFSTERVLTGADFDIESMQKVKDGSFYFGDEFGPFLIHTDSTGKVLEAPIPLPDLDNPGKEVRAPQNPFSEEISAIRIMNAMTSHSRMNGGKKTPVFSPNSTMIADGNVNTFIPSRKTPPVGSGLAEASSEIFNVQSIKNAGYPVVAWTVNDTATMRALLRLGVNGIISDRPDLLREVVKTYDANKDGKPDFLDADSLVDIKLLDMQGHRGGRNLRPENTLPAMEVALDFLVTTLETDCGITKDGIPVLGHDPHLEAIKFRRTDGLPYLATEEVLIKDLTLAEIQAKYIADKLLLDRPLQKNDMALSPVSSAFATAKTLPSMYVIPSVQQLFDFVKFYAEYYKTGAGKDMASANMRWKNAEKVRFNLETKLNPRSDKDAKGEVFGTRTVAPEPFAKAVADVIVANKMEDRADIQSFDFRTLKIVQELYPSIRTVYLFTDGPIVGASGDGTNTQDEMGANTPWMAGLYWPYRKTAMSNSFRAQGSGGYEGMALDSAGTSLWPLLEKPLIGAPKNEIRMHEYSLISRSFTTKRFKYLFQPKGAAIGDFILFGKDRGLIIERDNTTGDLKGFKSIYEIKMIEDNKPVGKRLAVDLMNIRDTSNLSTPGLAGDVGLGSTFAFPFVTIEDVVFYDKNTIGVLNDNNYPFSVGRHMGAKVSDDNEFIILTLQNELGKFPIVEKDSIAFFGGEIITGVVNMTENAEGNLLNQNRPNPFSESTQIVYQLKKSSLVILEIYNRLGQKVRSIVQENQSAGVYTKEWDGLDDQKNKVAPGVYSCVLRTDDKVSFKNMIKID